MKKKKSGKEQFKDQIRRPEKWQHLQQQQQRQQQEQASQQQQAKAQQAPQEELTFTGEIQKRLKALPKRAQVAFAARCVRRVQPLFKHYWPNASKKQTTAIDTAIAVAEQFAAYPANAGAAYELDAPDFTHAVSMIALAANVAEIVYYMHDDESGDEGVVIATNAVINAVKVASASYSSLPLLTAQERDLQLLEEHWRRIMMNDSVVIWEDQEVFPPKFFGSLWPEGVPETWPVKLETSEKVHLICEIEVPEDATDEDVLAIVKELGEHANALHRAQGGHGLEVEEVRFESQVPSLVGAPA